jgi:hypothetical protein
MHIYRARGAIIDWERANPASGPAPPPAPSEWSAINRSGARVLHSWAAPAATPALPGGHWDLLARDSARVLHWYANDGSTPATGAPGGGEDEPKRKRRFVVRNGDELLVFDRQRDAVAAQAAIDEVQPEAPKPERRAKKPKAAPAAALPIPVQSIPLPDLRDLAVGNGMQAVYDEAMRLRDLERAVQLHQALREQEEAAEQERQEAIRTEAERLMAEFQRLKRRLWRQ